MIFYENILRVVLAPFDLVLHLEVVEIGVGVGVGVGLIRHFVGLLRALLKNRWLPFEPIRVLRLPEQPLGERRWLPFEPTPRILPRGLLVGVGVA